MIDKEKVIKGLYAHGYKDCHTCPYWGSGPHGSSECKELAREALALLKEHEAKWIYGEDETGVDGWHCSECNFFEPWFYDFTDDINFIRFYKHCPNCRSKMTSYTGKPTQDRW